jgi:hypothetical protein
MGVCCLKLWERTDFAARHYLFFFFCRGSFPKWWLSYVDRSFEETSSALIQNGASAQK